MTTKNSRHVIPLDLALRFRADGLSWPLVREKVWLTTGEWYDPGSFWKALDRRRKSQLTDYLGR